MTFDMVAVGAIYYRGRSCGMYLLSNSRVIETKGKSPGVYIQEHGDKKAVCMDAGDTAAGDNHQLRFSTLRCA